MIDKNKRGYISREDFKDILDTRIGKIYAQEKKLFSNYIIK